MKWLSFFPMLLLLLWPGFATAQDFSGSYQSNQDGEIITLRLAQDAKGGITGAMRAEGVEYTLKGRREGESARGSLAGDGETLRFSARFDKGKLVLTVADAESTPGGQAETLVFQRVATAAASRGAPASTQTTQTKPANKTAEVKINGVALSREQIDALQKTYSTRPLPGNYWYDAKSGLYGVVGYQAFGFMLPGHRFGALDANASNGNTNVFVNGRQLPQVEWAVWSQLLGYVIQPGRYWLDANGNAGYEGNPIPTENLYQAARRNAYRGDGGGGSDTWSTRFSSGGYDSGGQRGYVSVPGHGPVGYGFD